MAAEAGTRGPFHSEEFVRIPHRVDAEEEHVEEREGDGDDAKAERDRRDDRQRDERRPPERAQRETDVARERLKEGNPAFVAALVRGERHGAEACPRALARFLGTEASGHEVSRFTFDVEGQLVVELALDFAWREEGANPEPEIVERHRSGELHDAVDRG